MIRALVLDVDGVLTDGGIMLDDDGRESKRFHARDGVGIKLALAAGWRVLFCTARNSQPARLRAAELGAECAAGIRHKDQFLEGWLREAGVTWSEVAFVGDDLQDIRVLRRVGYPIAVADACVEVRAVARHVLTLRGGFGAVREAVEWLLEQTGDRERVISQFIEGTTGYAVGDERL